MRKSIIMLLLLVFSLTTWAQDNYFKTGTTDRLEVVKFNMDTNLVSFSMSGFNLKETQTDRGNAFLISAVGSSSMLIAGTPDIPKFTTSLIIPDNGGMEVNVTYSAYTDYQNIEIAPSKGNLYRNVNPDDVAYIYGEVYNKNAFFPGELAMLGEPYILRDFRAQALHLFPFQYNPVKKVLRVYHDLNIEVKPNNSIQGKNNLQRQTPVESIVREFHHIYESRFANYGHIKNAKYTPLEESGEMLIISYGPFMGAMQAFVDWKNTIGMPTQIVDVATIGNTTTDIKNYIASVYNTSDLTYVLLVGDAAQVVTNTSGGGWSVSHSDNEYGYLVGGDSYPEVFIGRFSAETVAHVETQVQRTIEYELYPTTQNNLFNKAIGIASEEGPGHNNLLDFQHMRVVRDTLLNYHYHYVGEFYEGSQGGLDAPGNPTKAMIANEFNDGIGLINYVGHGWEEGWVTSDFDNDDVNSLTNTHLLPFIWSVACVNGDFVDKTCFAEAFLRATHNNAPAGAVAAFMSTINQSWNPPMSAQLEMNDILTESYTNNIKRTFGGLSMNGCMKMNDDYGQAGAEMTDTWTIFGDPSLMVRTTNPSLLTVSHDTSIVIGESSLLVNCATEDAFVSLTINNQIIGTGKVQGGYALISFAPLSVIDTITVAVTAFNHIPYLGEVLIIPPDGPFVIYNTHHIIDTLGNNNGMADYGETVALDVRLKNVGIHNADSVWAVISTNSPYITVNTDQNLWGDFIPTQEILLNGAFELSVSDTVPDNYSSIMSLVVRDNDTNVWNSSFVLKSFAPKFIAGSYLIDDNTGNNNGIADPGEDFELEITIDNIGQAGMENITGMISSTSPFLTINNAQYGIVSFGAGASINASFSLTADALTPLETTAIITFTLDAGHYSISKDYTIIIGMLPEYWMKDTSIYICKAYFFDSGGPNGTYSLSEDITMTFYPSITLPENDNVLSVEFLEFDIVEAWGMNLDNLRIYDGPNTDAPLIGIYGGADTIPLITSTHSTGALTFRFTSNSWFALEGWKARLTCVPAASIASIDNEANFLIYPNPVNGNGFYLSFSKAYENLNISIFNVLGKEIRSIGYKNVSSPLYIELNNISQGLYILQYATDKEIKSVKFVVE